MVPVLTLVHEVPPLVLLRTEPPLPATQTVVALVQPPLNLKLDEFEVAEAFEAPLSVLLDPANRQVHSLEIEGRQRQYYAMPWEGYYIWGATAGMLVSLQRYLFERD